MNMIITYEMIFDSGLVRRSHHFEKPMETVKHSENNMIVITVEINDANAASNQELK